MDGLSDYAKNFASGARRTADIAMWAGNLAVRVATAPFRGVCTVCNNLRPHGHENTYGRVGAALMSEQRDLGSPSHAPSDIPLLVLQNISAKGVLVAREAEPERDSRRPKCRYCGLLCDIFDAFFVNRWMSWIVETKNGMPINFGLMIREGAPLIINCYNFTYDKHSWSPRVDLEVYVNDEAMLQNPEAPMVGVVGSRSQDVRSPDCFEFIQQCLKQCQAEHEPCQTKPDGFIPTRLLYIGGNDEELAVHDTFAKGQVFTWAAFSHCWGGEQPSASFIENWEARKLQIQPSELTDTFRDAITVARELAFSYIWIDALCIKQNDIDDFRREAAMMNMVYTQASLVISAVSSSNSSTPFLGPRKEDWLPKRFEIETSQDPKFELMVRKRALLSPPLWQGNFDPPYTSAWASLKHDGPLHNRGWCFQESFLARRNVQFTPGAVVWECKVHRRVEGQLPPYSITLPGTLGEKSDMEKWHMVVRAYTRRQLTLARDKLPALSGAANSMPQARRSRYLAGLWHESLLLDLLWHVLPGAAHEVLSYHIADNQLAPTWSWASINRGVVWDTLDSPQLLAEVLDATANHIGPDQYGEVNSGRLLLRGRLRPCTLLINTNRNEHWVMGSGSDRKHDCRVDGLLKAVTVPPAEHPLACRANWNDQILNDTLISAFAFCVAKTRKNQYDHVGLVVTLSPNQSNCYERVGLVNKLPAIWFDQGTDTTFSLI